MCLLSSGFYCNVEAYVCVDVFFLLLGGPQANVIVLPLLSLVCEQRLTALNMWWNLNGSGVPEELIMLVAVFGLNV